MYSHGHDLLTFLYPQRYKSVKVKFTPEDDIMLMDLVQNYSDGIIDWHSISNKMKNKSSRQCRERYQNYLDPSIDKSKWTEEEDKILLHQYNILGSSWNKIAKFLTGRSGNMVRNRYMVLNRRMNKKNKKQSQEKNQNFNNIAADRFLMGDEPGVLSSDLDEYFVLNFDYIDEMPSFT